jgi:multidrug efflux pump subunit AcrB
MWLVTAALRRPYTVWVGMLLVTVLGILSYRRTPTDILPSLKVPVVVVFASYRGMPAPDMEQSVTTILEHALTRCDHLDHLESRSLLGIGIVKAYFRPEVSGDQAASQVLSLVTSEMQNLPPGMLPPTVMKYDASAVPVGNLVVTSASRDDKFLLDLADHQLREELAGIEGLASAPVFGGVFRQVQIYVHPQTLEALKLSPLDVARLVNNQSQVIPTGEMRIGRQTYYVSSNAMVAKPEDFARIPLFSDGRKTVFLGDIADVVDGTRWRTNTVRVDGRRAVYAPLLRQAGASAVRVVDNVQNFLPELHERGVVPDDVEVEVAFDQSQYVRDALANLRLEAVMGAVLASLVVLLFLGSLRSTWIVGLSIPLSVLAAFAGLYFSGETLNIMTLGGIALVLGRVVDDSIVDVENTNRHLNMGKTPFQAALDSAREISVPVLLATVTTAVVFLPLTFLTGVGKHLFTPLAFSAALALFASYFVSRTVSPLFCSKYLRPHGTREHFPPWLLVLGLVLLALGAAAYFVGRLSLPLDRLPPGVRQFAVQVYHVAILVGVAGGGGLVLVGLLFRISPLFDRLFEVFAAGYERALRFCLRWRMAVAALVIGLSVPAYFAFRGLGQELFPEVDAGEFTVHVRAAGGPRVEETERQVEEIEGLIREVVPPEDLQMILANVGISSRWSAIYTSNNGPHAAFVRVQLRSGFEGRTTPATEYVNRLRDRLEERFPGNDFFFETGGIIRGILNAGAVAPIEVQVYGRDNEMRRQVARILDKLLTPLPGVRDTYLPQGMDLPQLRVVVDRTRAARPGLTESDVVRNVITTLMSSAQIAPNFWIDPQTGNPYFIGVQYPEYAVEDVQTLEKIPITAGGGAGKGGPVLRLEDVAHVERTQGPIEVYHYDANRVSQLFVSVADNDLAGAAAEVEHAVQRLLPLEWALMHLPPDKAHLAESEDFRHRLRVYLKNEATAARQDVQTRYGLDPATLKLPKGIRVKVRGEVSNMRDSFQEMAFSLLLAVLLVYLVMAAQFSSWLDPLVMIVSAPLGLIGVALTLWATGTSLNVQSCMGVLMMVGISVSNSVLLVEFANRLLAGVRDQESGVRDQESGTRSQEPGDGGGERSALTPDSWPLTPDSLTPGEAVVRAARIRLRPILMTTIATVVGLLPMAVHLHPGDEMNLPLARAVIGGLIGSTLLTLFVVPVLYSLLHRRAAPATVES